MPGQQQLDLKALGPPPPKECVRRALRWGIATLALQRSGRTTMLTSSGNEVWKG